MQTAADNSHRPGKRHCPSGLDLALRRLNGQYDATAGSSKAGCAGKAGLRGNYQQPLCCCASALAQP